MIDAPRPRARRAWWSSSPATTATCSSTSWRRASRCLGVEPARNVAEAARASAACRRSSTSSARQTARGLVGRGPAADLIVGNNVLAQVPDLNDFVGGIDDPAGAGRRRSPSSSRTSMRLIEGNQFDTIYHEHFSYFSLLDRRAASSPRHGLTVFDVEELPTHGGSLRRLRPPPERRRAVPRSRWRLSSTREERGRRSRTLDDLRDFGERVEETKRGLLEFLIAARRDGQARRRLRGARARATRCSTTAASGRTSSTTPSTATPTSTGGSCPGTHIPIHPPERHRRDPPGLHPDPALEPASDEIVEPARLRPRVGRPVRRRHPEAGGDRREGRALLRRPGLRMREASETMPKPMVPIGDRPILWHVMKYYAHFGHTEFILCLGYKGDVDQGLLPQLQRGALQRLRPVRGRPEGRAPAPATSTTGRSPSSTPACTPTSASGCRRCEPHLDGEEMFLANYGDVLTDAPLDDDDRTNFRRAGEVAAASSAVQPELHLPRRPTGPTSGRVDRHRATSTRVRPLDQRRLLRLPPRDLRLHGAGRGAGRASRSSG